MIWTYKPLFNHQSAMLKPFLNHHSGFHENVLNANDAPGHNGPPGETMKHWNYLRQQQRCFQLFRGGNSELLFCFATWPGVLLDGIFSSSKIWESHKIAETNSWPPENMPSQKEMSSSNHWFSGALRRVVFSHINRSRIEWSVVFFRCVFFSNMTGRSQLKCFVNLWAGDWLQLVFDGKIPFTALRVKEIAWKHGKKKWLMSSQ